MNETEKDVLLRFTDGEGVVFHSSKKTTKGGEGSGNFGHEGRPGEVGGSGGGGGSEKVEPAPKEDAAKEDASAYPTDTEFTQYLDNSLQWARDNELPWRDAGKSIEDLEAALLNKPYDNMPQAIWEEQLRADVKESLTTLHQLKDEGIAIPNFTFNPELLDSKGAKAMYSYSEHELYLGTNMGEPANAADAAFNYLHGGEYTPTVSEQTIRGTVYHEITHSQADLARYAEGGSDINPQGNLIEHLSDADKEQISKVSNYAAAAVNRTEINGFIPTPDEAFTESVGAFADGNNPLRTYVPNSVKDAIVHMYGSAITTII